MELVFETIRLLCFVVPILLIVWRLIVKFIIEPKKPGFAKDKHHIQDKIIIVSFALFALLNIVNGISKNYFSSNSFIDNVEDLLNNSQFTEEEKKGGISEDYQTLVQASDSTPITEFTSKEPGSPEQPSILSSNGDWSNKETKVLVQNYDKENQYKYYISSYDDKQKGGKWLDMEEGSAIITKEGTSYIFVKAINGDSKESNISSPLIVKIDKTVPTKPEITGGNGNLTTSPLTIKISKESTAKSGIKIYEYYISTKSNMLDGGLWRELENNEVKISNIGNFFVFVRSISNSGLISPISKYEETNIDGEIIDPLDSEPDPVEEVEETASNISLNTEVKRLTNTSLDTTAKLMTNTTAVPARPVLGSKYRGWISIDNIITVDKTAAGKVPVDHYMYYVSSSKTVLKGGSWIRMNGNSFKFKKDGKWFVFVKAVGKNGQCSKLSAPYELWFDLNKPTTPTVTGGSNNIALSRKISVVTPSQAKSGINSYEYYISSSSSTPTGGSWITMKGSNVTITAKGTHYVFIRGVSWSWMCSNPTSAQKVVIGNPTVEAVPEQPKLSKKYNGWISVANVIKVTSDTSKTPIDHYEYYISTSKTELKNGSWIKMSGNSFKFIKDGIWYAFVKAVNKKGLDSKLSAPLELWFDLSKPSAPIITGGSSNIALARTISVKTDSTAKSGINSYEYYISTNEKTPTGGEWKELTNKNVTITEKGTHYIFFRGISWSWLCSNPSNSQKVVIGELDNEPVKPVIKKKYNGWSPVENVVTVDTSLAGKVPVDHYEYYISTSKTELKNGSWNTMSGNTLKYSKNGIWYVYVRAVSKKGVQSKTSEPLELLFDLDKPTTPTITGGSTTKISTRTISISKDSTCTSGVDRYEYYISNNSKTVTGGSWQKLSGKSVTISISGTHYIFFRSVSKSGLVSDISNSQTVVIDNTSVNKQLGAPVLSRKYNGWISIENIVTVDEKLMGNASVDHYEYYVSSSKIELKDGSWNLMNGNSFKFRKDGIWYAYVKAVGKDNSESELSEPIELWYDLNKPTSPAITGGSSVSASSRIISVSKESTAKAGINSYEYYISSNASTPTGGDWKEMSGKSITITDKGTHYIFFRAISWSWLESDASNSQQVVINSTSSSTSKDDTISIPTDRKLTSGELGKLLVYTGDSRTVGLSRSVDDTNIKFIAKDGTRVDYQTGEARVQLEKLLNSNPERIVVFASGVNDDYNIQQYLTYYNEMIKKYPKTRFYFMSLLPIDHKKFTKNLPEANLVNFNNKLKNAYGTKYIDIYSKVLSNVSNLTNADGIHYTWDAYAKINDMVQEYIINDLEVETKAKPSTTTGSWNELNLSKVLIYTGDSRTNRTKNAINDSNITFVCKEGTDYYYQVGTAKTEIEKILAKDPYKVVIFASGVNDMSWLDDYIAYYKQMIAKWPKTKFYFMTISPIDFSIMPYSTTQYNQTKIDRFNSRLKSEFKDKYIDIYDKMANNLKGNTLDGLHYTPAYYKEVHKMVMEYVVNNLNGTPAPTPTPSPTTGTWNAKTLGKALIYTGDSRTKILSGSVEDNNITFFAEDSTGYEYQVGYAKTQIEKILAKDPNKVVVFASGVNDMENIDKYVAYYKQMNTKWPKTKFYYLSINPIDYSICPYKVQQTLVDMFNARLKKEFPTRYIDMYNKLKDQLKGNTQDGLHYTYEFSGKVNDMIVEYLVNDLNGSGTSAPVASDPTPAPAPSTPQVDGTVNVTSYGANGNDSNDDTNAFKKAIATGKKVYVPAGTYHLQWESPEGLVPNPSDPYSPGMHKDNKMNVDSLVGRIYGPGLIIIDGFMDNVPTLRDKSYDNIYGKFYADDINDELWTSMNLTHEATSINLNVYQQRWNGVAGGRKLGSLETINGQTGVNQILNSWGQIVLRMDATKSMPSPSQAWNIYIGSQGLLGYNEYTKKWEILLRGIGGQNQNGSMWVFDFRTEDAIGEYKEAPAGKFNKVTIQSNTFTGYCYHFWNPGNYTVTDYNKYKYFIAYYDAYTDNDQAAKSLVGLAGSDIKSKYTTPPNPGFMDGRYTTISRSLRRYYTHNMPYEIYKKIGNKASIDNLIDMDHYGKTMITN